MKKSENVEKECRREKNDTPGKGGGIEKRRRSSHEVCAEKKIRSDHSPDQISLKNKPQDGSSRSSDIIFSGDITLDSVKDHMVSQSLEINITETPSGSRTERIETISRTMESVSIRTQQIVTPETPTPSSSSIGQDGAGESAAEPSEN